LNVDREFAQRLALGVGEMADLIRGELDVTLDRRLDVFGASRDFF